MAFLILSTIFIFFFVPETKNRTFEDISSSFGKKHEVNQNEYELQGSNKRDQLWTDPNNVSE